MNYILKQFDEPLVKFSATTDTSEPEIQILWTNEEKAAFLPLGLTLTLNGLSATRILVHRQIHKVKKWRCRRQGQLPEAGRRGGGRQRRRHSRP